jgi:predicted GH43/DUF377 family glycosyl hydrolase
MIPQRTILKIGVFAGALILIQACKQETPVSPSGWAFTAFEKVDSINPILKPTSSLPFSCPLSDTLVYWESRNVLNPAAVVNDGKVYLFYRAQDAGGTSRIGMAVSKDGLHFEKHPTPVLYPNRDSMMRYEWNYKKLSGEPVPASCTTCYFDGTEDPRIVADGNGRYIMTYTAYDGKTARLCVASSTDLVHWTKHGLALKGEKYQDMWSKSGAIVAAPVGDQVVARQINGKYWMYFGDTNIFLATSSDLIKDCCTPPAYGVFRQQVGRARPLRAV